MKTWPSCIGGVAAIFMLSAGIAGCGQSDYPELAQAKAFALQEATNVLSEARAADLPAITAGAYWLPEADPAMRVATARKYGPVRPLRPPACALQTQDTTEYCDGGLFIFAVDGIARSGGRSSKLAICHSDTAGWELAAERFQFSP
ncbi:hypothetical protein [Lichenifustis flavocetrariae]|uniref:Lipoprotein n=1 Tax=Lichenifustis flavocetrariae TaxID=2949735 RepID=A0AA41Z5Q1_9HYPH|nr:hypothetical protein [Lichenifustis flavocetrariae]MCW6513260.1 hypothetical protein [Lichenifustis flavocetrariae]